MSSCFFQEHTVWDPLKCCYSLSPKEWKEDSAGSPTEIWRLKASKKCRANADTPVTGLILVSFMSIISHESWLTVACFVIMTYNDWSWLIVCLRCFNIKLHSGYWLTNWFFMMLADLTFWGPFHLPFWIQTTQFQSCCTRAYHILPYTHVWAVWKSHPNLSSIEHGTASLTAICLQNVDLYEFFRTWPYLTWFPPPETKNHWIALYSDLLSSFPQFSVGWRYWSLVMRLDLFHGAIACASTTGPQSW